MRPQTEKVLTRHVFLLQLIRLQTQRQAMLDESTAQWKMPGPPLDRVRSLGTSEEYHGTTRVVLQ